MDESNQHQGRHVLEPRLERALVGPLLVLTWPSCIPCTALQVRLTGATRSHTQWACRKQQHVARSRQWRLLTPWGDAGKGWPWGNYGSSQRKRYQHSQRESGMRSAVTAGFSTVHTLLMNMQMWLVPEAGGEHHLLNSSVKPLWKGVCQEHGNEINPLHLWTVRGFGFHPKASDLSLLCLEPLV